MIRKKKLSKKLSNPKNQFSLLAELRKFKYHSANKGKIITQNFPKGTWSLLWNPVTKELIGINNKLLKKLNLENVDGLFDLPAMKSFIAFQDHKSMKDYDFSNNFSSTIQEPKWVLLAKAKEVEYYSDKFNKGDYWTYYHEFGEYDQSKPIVKDHGVMIYYDVNNGLIKFTGGKLTVNNRGIIN